MPQMHLNAFIFELGHHESAWRLPESQPADLVDLDYYQGLARTAERGSMDAIFFADLLTIDSSITRKPCELLDPTLLLTAMSAVTEHIGLIATASTTYDDPYLLARRFATLDHLSKGRAGWNCVTTADTAAAANHGHDEPPTHAERYERAAEFLRVVQRLWDSWEADAVIANKATGIYADRDRISPIDHLGSHFKVRGPLNVPRPPQGRPVLVQAGSSPAGIAQAAEHAEAVFTAQQTLEDAQRFYQDLKAAVRRFGRDPNGLKVLPGVMPIIGSTEQEAARLEGLLTEYMTHDEGLELLADMLGIPAAELDLDGPVPENTRAVETYEGNKSRFLLISEMARRERLTVRQVLNRLGGGRGHRIVTGTPEQIADFLETWVTAGGADGFNVMPPVLPSGLEIFVDEVVPVLQKRGLFRTEYAGSTLREHYGLPSPS